MSPRCVRRCPGCRVSNSRIAFSTVNGLLSQCARYTCDPHEVIRSYWSITGNSVMWPIEDLLMRKRVVVCAIVAFAVTATKASAQTITNMVKRVGVGGSFGGIFTFDDDVANGAAFGFNFGLAPMPGFGPTLGLGWYQQNLTLSG